MFLEISCLNNDNVAEIRRYLVKSAKKIVVNLEI